MSAADAMRGEADASRRRMWAVEEAGRRGERYLGADGFIRIMKARAALFERVATTAEDLERGGDRAERSV